MATSFVLVAGLLVAVLVTIGARSTRVPGATSAHHGAAITTVRAVALPGPFIPQQVVSAAGRIWVVGSVQPTDRQCELEEVDPTTLHTTTFPLPECAPYVAVGDGHIFLSADTFTRATDSDAFRIESVDTATDETTGVGGNCNGPQRLWSVDAAAGNTELTATPHPSSPA